jgi:CHAT domain-containing protein
MRSFFRSKPWLASLVALGWFFSLSWPATGQKYLSGLAKSEQAYLKGQYADALKNLDKTTSKAKKKTPRVVGLAAMYRAKYCLAFGKYDRFEQSVNEFVNFFKNDGANSPSFALAQAQAALLWGQYGHPGKAEEWLRRAEAAAKTSVGPTGLADPAPELDELAAKLLAAQLQVYLLRGHFAPFYQLWPAASAASLRYAGGATGGFDLVANSAASGKPTELERADRQAGHGTVLAMRGAMARLQGDYSQAEKWLAEAGEWLQANGGRNSEVWAYTLSEQAQLALDRGLGLGELFKLLDRTASQVANAVSEQHPLALRLNELLIALDIDNDFNRGSRKAAENLTDLAKREFGNNSPQYGLAEMLEARYRFRVQEYDEADRLLRALESNVGKFPRTHPSYLRLLQQAYDLAIVRDDYPKAVQLINQEVDHTSFIYGLQSLPFELARLRQARHFALYTNRYLDSKIYYRDGFTRYVQKVLKPSHKDLPGLLADYAAYNELVGEYDSALAQRRQGVALALARSGEGGVPHAVALDKLNNLQMQLGNFKGMDESVARVLDIFGRKPDKVFNLSFSNALETAARYHAATGQFRQARFLLFRANRLYNRSNGSIVNSTGTDDLTALLIATERYEEAQQLLAQTLEVRRARYGDNSRFLLGTYSQMAKLQLLFGDYFKAEDYAKRALRIAVATFEEGSVRTAEPLALLAEVHAAEGDYVRAKDEIGRVVALQTRALGRRNVQVAQSLRQAALIRFYNQENLGDIEKLLQESANIVAENLGEGTPLYAESLKTLALVNLENRKYAEASQRLQQAAAIWAKALKTTNSVNAAALNLIMGDVASRQGKAADAEARYAQAREGFRELLGEKHPDYIRSLSRLARLQFGQGNLANCGRNIEQVMAHHASFVGEFFPAMTYREKLRYWNLIRGDVEFYYNYASQHGPRNPKVLAEMYGYVAFFKTLLIGNEGKARTALLSTPDSAVVRNYRRWVGKKQQLTQGLALSPEQQKELGVDLAGLQKEIEDLEKLLAKESGDFALLKDANRWVGADQIRQALRKHEAAVEIVRFLYFDKNFTDSVVYVALVQKEAERNPLLVPLPGGKLLEDRHLRYYRNMVKFGLADTLTYTRYWQPVDAALGKCQRVYVAADGVYNQVNLDALLKHDQVYVIDELAVVALTTTSELLAPPPVETDKKGKGKPTAPASRSYVFLGNPVFYKDLPPEDYLRFTSREVPQLPGTYREAKELQALVAGSQSQSLNFVTTEATEARVKALRSPTVLHIATHGFFAPDLSEAFSDNELNAQRAVDNPLLRSGLLLKYAGDLVASGNVYAYNREDGVLTAYEAADLHLANTELVVLSACETGRGEVRIGEGVYSLQRAFRAAGAKTVVMSLFKVDDDATRTLMEYFYKNWLQSGDKRGAFAEAKKLLRQTYPEPRHWGAFVMVGAE